MVLGARTWTILDLLEDNVPVAALSPTFMLVSQSVTWFGTDRVCRRKSSFVKGSYLPTMVSSFRVHVSFGFAIAVIPKPRNKPWSSRVSHISYMYIIYISLHTIIYWIGLAGLNKPEVRFANAFNAFSELPRNLTRTC